MAVKQLDGQLFVEKVNGRMYCRLGNDRYGNIIETTAYNNECEFTRFICATLISEGTTFLVENPIFLDNCQQ